LGTSWHGMTWLGYELTGNHPDPSPNPIPKLQWNVNSTGTSKQ